MKKITVGLTALATWGSMFAFGPTQAFAASGGGCTSWHPQQQVGTMRSCINAPAKGRMTATGYVTLQAGHMSCKYQVNIWNSSNVRVATTGQLACPATSTYKSVSYSANSGKFRSSLQIFWSNGTSDTQYSPNITMP